MCRLTGHRCFEMWAVASLCLKTVNKDGNMYGTEISKYGADEMMKAEFVE